MSAELKPCPFCGSSDVKYFGYTKVEPDHFVQCQNCTMIGPGAESKEDAIELWNRRAPSPSGKDAQEADLPEFRSHGAALMEVRRLNLELAKVKESLSRDAARYRFLRNHPLDGLEETTPCIRAAEDDEAHWALTGDVADAAIDAAIQSEGSER